MINGKHARIRSNVMPPMITLPNDEHLEAHTLESEQRQAQEARPGFWRSLTNGMTMYLTAMPSERHAPSCRRFETPMDRFAKDYSSLSLLALAII
jgi:hypothetical protein